MSTILSCNCVHRGSQRRENEEEGSRRKKKNQKAVSVSPILSFVVISIIKTPDRICFFSNSTQSYSGIISRGLSVNIFKPSDLANFKPTQRYLPKISTAPRTSKHWFESTAVSGFGRTREAHNADRAQWRGSGSARRIKRRREIHLASVWQKASVEVKEQAHKSSVRRQRNTGLTVRHARPMGQSTRGEEDWI